MSVTDVEPACPSKCRHLVRKVYDDDMVSLLQLLVSREGTARAVTAALRSGVSVSEVHPRTKEGVLHVLFRRCVLPLELYDTVKVGSLTLVLGTHCKTDSRSCGCRLEKRGAVTNPRTLRRGAVRGAFPVGAVVVSLASPRKASWVSYN